MESIARCLSHSNSKDVLISDPEGNGGKPGKFPTSRLVRSKVDR